MQPDYNDMLVPVFVLWFAVYLVFVALFVIYGVFTTGVTFEFLCHLAVFLSAGRLCSRHSRTLSGRKDFERL